MLNQSQQQQLAHFNEAKKIALSISVNNTRRAKFDGMVTNYTGANVNGRMFVIADSLADLQNPDTYINGMPAREIFGDFTVMFK